MKKDLPGIFANKIDKKLENNKNCCVTKSEELSISKDDTRSAEIGLNINQKIQNIFNSSRYVYKADVLITTNEGKYEKRIIGKNGDNLITIENELISIGNIKDIEFKE